MPTPDARLSRMSADLYEHLKARGAVMMKGERRSHTLTPTALVNEAFVRLAENEQSRFNDRAHMMAAAALAMRRILIEHARSRARLRRGGSRARVSWDAAMSLVGQRTDPATLLAIDEALLSLASEGELGDRYARLAEFRLFGSMTNAQIAAVLDVSVATVEKDWKHVKSRLQAALAGDRAPRP